MSTQMLLGVQAGEGDGESASTGASEIVGSESLGRTGASEIVESESSGRTGVASVGVEVLFVPPILATWVGSGVDSDAEAEGSCRMTLAPGWALMWVLNSLPATAAEAAPQSASVMKARDGTCILRLDW